MWWRLFLPLALLWLALLAGLALVLPLLAGPPLPLLAAVAGAAGLGLAGLALVSRALARRLARPLRDVVAAARDLGEARPARRVFADSHDELGLLAAAFNRLGERLTDRIERLEEDREQLRTILSGMVEGVVALDAEQRILYANDRAGQLLEFPTPAPVGRRLWEVVRQRPLLDVVQRALAGPEAQRAELNLNGLSTRSLTVHAARLPGALPRGAVLVLHDTSELRRLERLRQEFVANVSHELKTPLSVIKVCVETLLEGAVEDPAHRGRFLEQIAQQGDRLHALILDLLSLARIESGAELFEMRPLNVPAVLTAALDRHRPRAEASQQTLTLDGDGLAVALADEEALDQILDNLLDNALKYTPEGGHIRASWRAADGFVCLEIADTGIGIPEGDLPRIFERFYRVDKARSRELGGTGLGLSIVKHLTQAMHGSVRAVSRVGLGTTFTVCLPRAAPA